MTFLFLLKMSSTIDAAIIKALVEHIGGNSDEIPDGTIGGPTLTKQPGRIERWVNTEDGGTPRNEFSIVDDELRSGDILRLKFRKNDDETYYRDYMYIIVKDTGRIGQFISLDDMFYILTFITSNGKYRTDEGSADAAVDLDTDDNIGIYRFTNPTLAGFFKMFSVMMSTLHSDSL